MVSCFKKENNKGDGQITWGGGERGDSFQAPGQRNVRQVR